MTNNNQAFKSQPKNINQAQPSRFQLVASRIPNTTFWCQTVVLPGISTSYATAPTPFVDQKVPGDKAIYDSLLVSMIVDEDLQVWREIHNWIRGYTFPHDFSEYRNLKNLSDILKNNKRPQYSDIQLTIYNSSWAPILKYTYIDAFPTSLGALNYSASDDSSTTMLTDVTFDYQYFNVDVLTQSVA